ncbi:11385_t:CDS:1 [Acaulospora colombiana]|uniref:11385_t:CDS:1 n=1 Tax=Acaulospora colombiana TaxID=27376 RepID=A0ACA9KAX6_9GLOM|nr:11385_t:CDS:1 [Acaulospora colombiana]
MTKPRTSSNKRALAETTINEHQQLHNTTSSDYLLHPINSFGDDGSNNNNDSALLQYSTASTMMSTQPLSSRVSKRRRNRDTPPRPLNSFMIYRREYQKMIKEQNPNILLSELSRISKSAADKWANEPPNIKQIYAEKARAEKEQHMKLYPNYVYCPRRPTKTKPRKKSASEGSSSEKMSVNFLLNDDSNSFRSYNHSFTKTTS